MENNSKNIIRVLVVEDSPLMSKVLIDLLNADSRILVVGVAHNGKEAVEIVPYLKPDIITMDVDMPVMDGLEATKQIMAYNPTPILVVCAAGFSQGMDKAFKSVSFGALDIIEKQELWTLENKKSTERLIEKIKFLSGVKVTTHPLAKFEKEGLANIYRFSGNKVLDRMVSIIASTGGPEALVKILKKLPADFPCGITIVQHIAKGFEGGLADWLGGECQIKVKVAQDSEEIQPAVAYIAPYDLQMRVEEDKKINLSNEPPHNGFSPSGDVLLESVGKVYKGGAIGVALTGMGKDGAMGMKAIKQMYGKTIAQNEASCAVFGIPKAAIDLGVVDKVLSPEEIAEEIIQILNIV